MYNWILIGFKSCGKNTLGKKLSRFFQKEFVDLDEEIEKTFFLKHYQNIPVRKIYESYGEEYFRLLESHVLHQLIGRRNMVLATGGGTILRNGSFLKTLGICVYVKQPKEILLERMKDMPPAYLSTPDDFEKIYHYRRPIYESLADFILPEDVNPLQFFQKLNTHGQ